MKNECYDVMFRKKIYSSLDEVQRDVDQWITWYNQERSHSGKHCYGKTPWQTWEDAKHLAKDKQLNHLFKSADNHTCLTNQ